MDGEGKRERERHEEEGKGGRKGKEGRKGREALLESLPPRRPCFADGEFRSRSACLAMSRGSWPLYSADMVEFFVMFNCDCVGYWWKEGRFEGWKLGGSGEVLVLLKIVVDGGGRGGWSDVIVPRAKPSPECGAWRATT